MVRVLISPFENYSGEFKNGKCMAKLLIHSKMEKESSEFRNGHRENVKSFDKKGI